MPDDSPSAAIARLMESLQEMQQASDLIDESYGGSDYNARLIALALIAREFLRRNPDAALRACAEARPSIEKENDYDVCACGHYRSTHGHGGKICDGWMPGGTGHHEAQCLCAGFHLSWPAAPLSSPPRAEARPSTEQGWQPIETAPKDGTYVLVAMLSDRPDNDRVYRVSQAAFNGLGWYEKSGESCHWRTHWVPMPQKQPAAPHAEAGDPFADEKDLQAAGVPPRAEALAPHPQHVENEEDTRGGSQ